MSMTKKDQHFLVGKSDLKMAFVSSYPPRVCGIATFARPLERVVNELYLSKPADIVAVSDEKYSYDKQVKFTISDQNKKSFADAAGYLNKSDVEIVNVQHEYGLYGGPEGEHVLAFYETIKKPVVTTLHSVLTKHSSKRAWITQKILDRSDAVIVMTELAKDTLLAIFPVDEDKIEVIPHGVPNIRPNQQPEAKKKLKLENHTILSTFGLLNPGKGIEYGIRALPEVAKQVPNVLYLVIGATHPVVKRNHGELYREFLKGLAAELGVADHVQFIDKYLDYPELIEYLKATDIYLMLQLDPNQAFSGTTAYALGCGKPIIGTPTPYNREVLAEHRGEFVPFENEYSLTKKINRLLKDDHLRKEMAMRAYRYGRDMIWPRVALDYMKVFDLILLKQLP